MSEKLWQLFQSNYRQNCLSWHHSEHNPVIPASGDTWRSVWVANPDTLTFGGRQLLYYRGNGIQPGTDGQRHDRLGVAEIVRVTRNTIELRDLNDGEPIVDVGGPDEFDGKDVLDPSVVAFGGRVYAYYSAIGAGPDCVGLAVSEDGVHFEKVGNIMEGRAPAAIVKDGSIYMIYQLLADNGYRLYLSRSRDGIHFESVSDKPIFVGEAGSWDALSIVTARLMQDGDHFYMMYGGSSYLADEPDFFGLARSTDLLNWERHPGNPIFGCGAMGQEDGGAIWFPALIETEDAFVILYEGSRGKYSWDISSQICMASIAKA
ncbi:hypothetical protein [Paenibacillus sacheonensis]|uniref:Uncharacterized protein n=1 Tax=Paenibacillus sacheonensis TaxID=742054 RepID=A0A7X5BZC0_9BACL|nr:hypothetical protein [Paenibacillus sacheonensis]MBM7568823.1 putative GH43/DUF377 family glycosyl hydrolase [Paenibacillus sacheonensis]NBC72528.1 hypothetical protein [Paenibacillus sacheonensis]